MWRWGGCCCCCCCGCRCGGGGFQFWDILKCVETLACWCEDGLGCPDLTSCRPSPACCQGPITMMNGKQGVVEFRNPFDKPTDFSLQAYQGFWMSNTWGIVLWYDLILYVLILYMVVNCANDTTTFVECDAMLLYFVAATADVSHASEGEQLWPLSRWITPASWCQWELRGDSDEKKK